VCGWFVITWNKSESVVNGTICLNPNGDRQSLSHGSSKLYIYNAVTMISYTNAFTWVDLHKVQKALLAYQQTVPFPLDNSQ